MEYEVDTYYLISLIEKRPVLWDSKANGYQKKFVTHGAWREICVLLNKNYERWEDEEQTKFCNFVIKKWRNIKDCWYKWNKRKRTQKNKQYLKRYVYDEQLTFLRNSIKSKVILNSWDTATTTDDDQTQTSESDEQPSTSFAAKTPTTQTATSQPAYKKHGTDDVEKSLVLTLKEKEDRHLSFMKGVLPSLKNFDETQVLKFQMGVLELINSIKTNIPEARMLDPLREIIRHESIKLESSTDSCASDDIELVS